MKDHQPGIFRAMEAEDFYPHAVDGIEQRETHISAVFLAGSFVYKIKKPMDLGFLDFTTLEKRRHYCHREVELNRRLTGDVYLEVVSITDEGNGYRLNGSGAPVEYAVKMRRLPEESSMVHMVRDGKIDARSITALAKALSKFYRQAETGTGIDELGSWQTVWKNWEENFKQMEPFAGSLIDARIFKIIQAATRSFMRRRKSLFDKRIDSGKIRDCHGDLRAEHIYYTDNGIQIIDCIEFNDRFRYSDITSDLAFLTMDLDFLGFPEAAGSLLTAYVDNSKDDGVFSLIEFYKCYRAVVRAKVNCFQLDKNIADLDEKEAIMSGCQRHMELAYQYAAEFTRPTLWVVCGMIASGKSTISMKLAEKFNVRILRSDVIRKALFDITPKHSMEASFGQGIYSEHVTSLTYGKLLRLAQEEIENGASVVLDAAFSDRHWRQEALRLAEDMDTNIIFIECTAKDATLKARLKQRSKQASVSDARLRHFNEFKESFDPLNDLHEDTYIQVDTDLPLEETMLKILASDYFLLSEQTASVIARRSKTTHGG
jgi:aminoglycoside phosphotransferase family enzyme/predicted kinase